MDLKLSVITKSRNGMFSEEDHESDQQAISRFFRTRSSGES